MLPDRDGYAFYYLMPGECYVGGKPVIVQTILGSCVAITMYDRTRKIGGMCHSILPSCPKNGTCIDFCDDSFRFADCALRNMLKKFKDLAMSGRGIEVKLFGGADMLEHYSNDSIGKQNIDSALEAIRAGELNLVAFDVGETVGRKMLFFTDTGEVYLKRLHKTAEGPVAPKCQKATPDKS